MQQRAAGGVRAIYYSPPGIVGAQIEAILEDFAVAAIKIGMLGSAEIANLVAVRRSWLPKTWTALAAR